MAKKIKVIGPFKLDMNGAKKIGKSFLLTVAAVGVVSLGDLCGIIDFGQYQNIAIIAVPFILNLLRKVIGTQEAK